MARNQWSKLPLTQVHVEELKASGITHEVAKARGYRSVKSSSEVEMLGFKRYQVPQSRMPGLVVPMYNPGSSDQPDSYQIKMATPRTARGREIKYETPSGLRNILDVNPAATQRIADPTEPLWIVEGLKKADALLSAGQVAVGIAGVWAWRGTNSAGGKTALAAFDDIALNGRTVYVCFDSDTFDKPQVRAAMERLVHYLRARGAEAKFLVVPAGSGGEKVGADDFLVAGGTIEQLVGHALDELPNGNQGSRIQYEAVTAELDGFRYVVDWGRWIRWDGRVWRMDTTQGHLVEGAIIDIIDPDRTALLGWQSSVQVSHQIRKTMERDERAFHVESRMLDSRPNLMNVANGTVDLRTGQLSPHNPENLLTKITAGAYLPGRKSEDIDAVTRGLVPDDCHEYLQRIFGYACTGTVTEELFIVFGGKGSNGKTTLLSAANAALGDYASPANPKLVMAGGGSEHSTIEADLFGRRLVYLSETEEGGVLAIERIKALSGGDQRSARRMREDYWQFDPTHTLVLATNHLPKVGSTDYGTWRRLRLIPFPYRFVNTLQRPNDRIGDSRLRHRVLTEQYNHDAFVTYCVQGAVAYNKHGLKDTPVSVLDATSEWRTRSDPFGAFLRELCVVAPGERVAQAALTKEYNQWARSAGMFTVERTAQWIKDQLENLGYELGFSVVETRSNGVRWLNGVRLVQDGEAPCVRVQEMPAEALSDDWYADLLTAIDEGNRNAG